MRTLRLSVSSRFPAAAAARFRGTLSFFFGGEATLSFLTRPGTNVRLDVNGRLGEPNLNPLFASRSAMSRSSLRDALDTVKEKFSFFRRSSFGRRRRVDLFEYIWRTFGRRISFYISNFIPRSHPGFEDVFQDVMLKIFENLHTFDPDRSFKAWIYTIAKNRSLDFLKSKEERLATLKAAPGHAAAAPDHTAPESRTIRRELVDRIDGILGKLAETDREISYLFFYENMKIREIARIVGMNVNTVKSRLRAVRAEIQKAMRGAA